MASRDYHHRSKGPSIVEIDTGDVHHLSGGISDGGCDLGTIIAALEDSTSYT